MSGEKFWLVWADNGGTPMHKHASYQSAKDEAKRLARANSGKKFHVLEHIGTAMKNDVSFFVHQADPYIQLDEDEIPF